MSIIFKFIVRTFCFSCLVVLVHRHTCVRVCVCMHARSYRSQRAAFVSQLSPSSMWIPRIELRLWGFSAAPSLTKLSPQRLFHFSLFCFVFKMRSLYVASHEFLILLLQSPECRDYRSAPPYFVWVVRFNERIHHRNRSPL